MSYRDQAVDAYIKTLRNRGVSDNIIQLLIVAFDSGFSAGTFNDEDESAQHSMIELLLETQIVN